jgi:hypothetical protein
MGKARGGFHSKVTRRRFGGFCFAWFCCMGFGGFRPSLAIAQGAPVPQESSARARLLTAKQGRAIVSAAREHEPASRATQDCSHLVQEIYVRAGFSYPYASSFDLYAGSESFERVKNPQPGDVIVWPGHAGIVFDPKQHVFYSLVSSGLDAEDYEAPYWKSRGKPRFYRYVVGNRARVITAGVAAGARTAIGAEQHDTARVVEDRSNADTSAVKRSATEASERSAVFDPAPRVAPAGAAAIPRSIMIGEGRKQPTPEQVAAGISELSSAAGSVLRSKDSARGTEQVVVYKQLQVESIEIKHDHGWALVQVESKVSLAGDEAELQSRSEEVRWELRRGKSGWEAVTPIARTFVPRDVAVRELSARLATLTQADRGAENSEAVRHEEAQLAKMLSALLEESGE